MRTSVRARLRSGFYPYPASCRTLLARPLLSSEHARRWCDVVEVALGASHSSCAGVTRYFHDLRCALVVLAIGPWTWELAVFVTMLGARLHCANPTSGCGV